MALERSDSELMVSVNNATHIHYEKYPVAFNDSHAMDVIEPAIVYTEEKYDKITNESDNPGTVVDFIVQFVDLLEDPKRLKQVDDAQIYDEPGEHNGFMFNVYYDASKPKNKPGKVTMELYIPISQYQSYSPDNVRAAIVYAMEYMASWISYHNEKKDTKKASEKSDWAKNVEACAKALKDGSSCALFPIISTECNIISRGKTAPKDALNFIYGNLIEDIAGIFVTESYRFSSACLIDPTVLYYDDILGVEECVDGEAEITASKEDKKYLPMKDIIYPFAYGFDSFYEAGEKKKKKKHKKKK